MEQYLEGYDDALKSVPIVSAEYATLEKERDELKVRIAELEKILRLCFQELYPTGTTFEDAYAEALKVANELMER